MFRSTLKFALLTKCKTLSPYIAWQCETIWSDRGGLDFKLLSCLHFTMNYKRWLLSSRKRGWKTSSVHCITTSTTKCLGSASGVRGSGSDLPNRTYTGVSVTWEYVFLLDKPKHIPIEICPSPSVRLYRCPSEYQRFCCA